MTKDAAGVDVYEVTESKSFKAAVEAMAAEEKLHPRAPLDALLLVAWPLLPIEAEAKPSGYPAGVEWGRAAPDDSEKDEEIEDADTLTEALWAISEKYDVPVTNNETRWQDGAYLREVGSFIGDIQKVYARFRPEPTPLDQDLTGVIDDAYLKFDAVAESASPADNEYFTEGFKNGVSYAQTVKPELPARETLAKTLYNSEHPDYSWDDEPLEIQALYYSSAGAVLDLLRSA